MHAVMKTNIISNLTCTYVRDIIKLPPFVPVADLISRTIKMTA